RPRVPFEDYRNAARGQGEGALENVALVALGVHPQHPGEVRIEDLVVGELVQRHRLAPPDLVALRGARLLRCLAGVPVLAALLSIDDQLRGPGPVPGRLAEGDDPVADP